MTIGTQIDSPTTKASPASAVGSCTGRLLARAQALVRRLLPQDIAPAICLCLSVGLLSIAGAGAAYAQNSNATIRGQVLDSSGALLTNARIVIVNEETGVKVFDGPTDSAGAFVAPQVLSGTYRITATAPGMKEAVLNDVLATVAQVTAVNVKMEVGATTEIVTVTSHDQELDSSTSVVSTLISPQEVASIPLNLRAPENLLTFVPGVAYGAAGDGISTQQLSINGSRTGNNEILLNGVSLIIASTGTTVALPSPDGIDELRFLTTNAPAEYGRTSGPVLAGNVVAGTNTYHGNAYLLMKNEALDANTFFNKLSNFANNNPARYINGVPNTAYKGRPRDRYFLFGGSFGGPIRIPHLYNGHDKTFFFVNYDKLIFKNSTLSSYSVPGYLPTAGSACDCLQRTGNFSEETASPIYMPGGTATAQFPGNIINTALDPAAVAIMSLLPLPNSVGTYDAVNHRATNNFTEQPVLRQTTLRLDARVDEQLSVKDRLAFVFYRNNAVSPLATVYLNPLINSNYDCGCSNAYIGTIDYTRIWSSTLVSDVNLGFFRYATFRNPPGAGQNAASQLHIANLPLNQAPEVALVGSVPTTPNTAVPSGGAISNIGGDANTRQINITNTYPIFGSVTKILGPHTFKVGASYRDNEFNTYNPASYPQGEFEFDGDITNHGTAGNVSNELADFLLGKVKYAQYELPQPATGRRNYNFGIFFQDDYKITTKLTLNAGLRYEFESPMTVSNNVYSRVNESNGQLLVANQNGVSRSLNITTAKLDFAPRIGFAYSPTDKTVVRGAYGNFYGTIFQNLGGQIAYPGFDTSVVYLSPGTAVAQPFALSAGFPSPIQTYPTNPTSTFYTNPLTNAAYTTAAPYQISGNQFGNLNKLPLVQQYNFGVEQKMPLGLTLEVNYVGNHSVHQPSNYPVNIVPLSAQDAVTTANTTTAQQNARPFPLISAFSETSDNGDSKYNSLQATLRRQFNKSLAILSNYTWAKSIDDASSLYNSESPTGTANAQFPGVATLRNADHAVSDIDIKNTVNIAMVYTTSGPWYTRGWKIAPTFTGHTGLPINITQTSEEINVGNQRPNGNAAGIKTAPYAVGTAIQYFLPPTTSNFPLTPSGPINVTIGGVRTLIVPTNQALGGGTTSRDSLRGPSYAEMNASVSKDFPIFERLKFNFRVDAFNLVNHTNFAPSSSLGTLGVATTTNSTIATLQGNTTFGRITATQPQRTLQIVGRFTF
jgi:hypothetical protein